MGVPDRMAKTWRTGNIKAVHKSLNVGTGNRAWYNYYYTKNTDKTGSLNDLMYRFWLTYIRPGSSTGVSSQAVGDGNTDNTVGTGSGTPPFVSITSAIGSDGAVILNYNYTDIGYEIGDLEYSSDGGFSWAVVPTLPPEIPFTPTVIFSSTVTIPELENGTLYSMSLRAVSGPDLRESLIPGSALVLARPNVSSAPDIPTSLVATPSNNSVNIAFIAGAVGTSAITGYEYTIDGGTTWAAAGSSTVSPVTVPGLTASTSYTIQLRAVNSVGASVASTSVTTTTLSAGFLGTGGTETTTGGYKYHVFTSNGTLTVTNPGVVEYLVVGGGGSGAPSIGSASGGGGGAGGYQTGIGLSVTANQTITVGAGGAAVTGTGSAAPGNKGSNSSIGSLVTVLGGGYGGSVQAQGASNGGSGGGKGANAVNTTPAGTGTSGQGNNGGGSAYTGSTTNAAGGGGGATSVGGDGFSSGTVANNIGGAGGSGAAPSWISNLTGVPTSFAGGGGGGIGGSTGTIGAGASGSGTGGNTAILATDATANTGSGGGGAGRAIATPYYSSGAGGSGIVIIRYAI